MKTRQPRNLPHDIPPGYVSSEYIASVYAMPAHSVSKILAGHAEGTLIKLPGQKAPIKHYPLETAIEVMDKWVSKTDLDKKRSLSIFARIDGNTIGYKQFSLPDISQVAKEHRKQQEMYWG